MPTETLRIQAPFDSNGGPDFPNDQEQLTYLPYNTWVDPEWGHVSTRPAFVRLKSTNFLPANWGITDIPQDMATSPGMEGFIWRDYAGRTITSYINLLSPGVAGVNYAQSQSAMPIGSPGGLDGSMRKSATMSNGYVAILETTQNRMDKVAIYHREGYLLLQLDMSAYLTPFRAPLGITYAGGRLFVLGWKLGATGEPMIIASNVGATSFSVGGFTLELGLTGTETTALRALSGIRAFGDKYIVLYGSHGSTVYEVLPASLSLIKSHNRGGTVVSGYAVDAGDVIFQLGQSGLTQLSQEVFKEAYAETKVIPTQNQAIRAWYDRATEAVAPSSEQPFEGCGVFSQELNAVLFLSRHLGEILYVNLGEEGVRRPFASVWSLGIPSAPQYVAAMNLTGGKGTFGLATYDAAYPAGDSQIGTWVLATREFEKVLVTAGTRDDKVRLYENTGTSRVSAALKLSRKGQSYEGIEVKSMVINGVVWARRGTAVTPTPPVAKVFMRDGRGGPQLTYGAGGEILNFATTVHAPDLKDSVPADSWIMLYTGTDVALQAMPQPWRVVYSHGKGDNIHILLQFESDSFTHHIHVTSIDVTFGYVKTRKDPLS